MKHQIVMNKELFKTLGDKLYSSRLDFILARELVQNAIDASKPNETVMIQTKWNGDYEFEITVDDIGIGMDENVLLDIFLSIGSTFKHDKNSTGGFGIAKVALFASTEWNIHTRDNYIDHTLEHKKIPYRKGTKVYAKVVFPQKYPTQLYHRARVERLVRSNNKTNIIYNGENVQPFNDIKELDKITTENDIKYSFGLSSEPITTQDGYNNYGYVFYRINGLTQYYEYKSALQDSERNLVIDFPSIGYNPTDDNYPFTLSRENLTDDSIKQYVNAWLESLAKDVLSKIRQLEENKDLKVEWINPRTGLISRSIDGKVYKPDSRERMVLNLWKNVVLSIKSDVDWQFAVTNNENTKAFYQYQYGNHIIGINPSIFLQDVRWYLLERNTQAIVMYIWHMAVHEITHFYRDEHDEKFAAYENQLARDTVGTITDTETMANLKRLARKLT